MITLKERLLLEKYITKTVTVESIAKIMGLSRATLYNEIKKGLPEGESDARKYSAELSQKKAEEKALRRLRGE